MSPTDKRASVDTSGSSATQWQRFRHVLAWMNTFFNRQNTHNAPVCLQMRRPKHTTTSTTNRQKPATRCWQRLLSKLRRGGSSSPVCVLLCFVSTGTLCNCLKKEGRRRRAYILPSTSSSPFSSTNACFHNLHVHSQAAVVSLVSHSRAACVKSFLSLCLNWRARRALSWHGVTSAPHTPGRMLTAAKPTGVCPETEERRSHAGTASHDSEVKQAFQPTSSFFVCFGCYIPFKVMERVLQAAHTPWGSCWRRCPGTSLSFYNTFHVLSPPPNQHLTAQKNPPDSESTWTCGDGGPQGCQEGSFYWLYWRVDYRRLKSVWLGSTSDWLQLCVQRLEKMLSASFTSSAC